MNSTPRRCDSGKEKPMLWNWTCALAVLVAVASAAMGQGVEPKWIWHEAPEPARPVKNAKPVEACFRRTVVVPDVERVTTAILAVTADASTCRVYVNGGLVGDKLSGSPRK